MPIRALVLRGSCSESAAGEGGLCRLGMLTSFRPARKGRISASPGGAGSGCRPVPGGGFEAMPDSATIKVRGRGRLISVGTAFTI